MGINCRILLPFLFIFYCFKGSSAQVSDVVTYTTKSVELECRFTSSVVQWTEQLDDEGAIVLFSYIENTLPTKKTNNSKYDNFNFSLKGANQFNLLITNVDKHDGGRYQCSSFSETPVTFDVNVEVLPESITINCTELNVCTASAERENAPQIVCNCMVTGISSDIVEIEWKGVSSLSTRNTTRDMDSTTGTFNISSETFLPSLNEGSSVSCSLTGYKSQIPEGLRSSTYTFTPPVCNLLMQECSSDGRSALLICNCTDGSPAINAYTFYDSEESAIGTQFSNVKSVQVDANSIETLYCSGCNGVMHNPKFVGHEVKCQQGSSLWILIIVILILFIILVAAILLVCIMNKYKKVGNCCSDSGDKEYVNVPIPAELGDPKKEPLLYSNIPTQENKKTKDDKDEEYDNVSMQELNKVEHHDNPKPVGSAGGHVTDGKKPTVKKKEAPKTVGSPGGQGNDGEKKAVKKEEASPKTVGSAGGHETDGKKPTVKKKETQQQVGSDKGHKRDSTKAEKKEEAQQQVGSDKGHKSDSTKAEKKEEANRKEKPSSDERTQGDGEENEKINETIKRLPHEDDGTPVDSDQTPSFENDGTPVDNDNGETSSREMDGTPVDDGETAKKARSEPAKNETSHVSAGTQKQQIRCMIRM